MPGSRAIVGETRAIDRGGDPARDLAISAVRLILDGETGLWPLTTLEGIKRPPVWVSSAECVIARLGEFDYLAPLPFVEQTRREEFVAEHGSVLWADIDPPKLLSIEEQQAFGQDRLRELRIALGDPSFVIDSGRGLWVWFKLSQRVAKYEIKRLNKILVRLAGSTDTTAVDLCRWTRLPGSVNEKTGRVSYVQEFTGRTFDPARLAGVLEREVVSRGISIVTRDARRTAPVGGAGEAFEIVRLPRTPILSRRIWDYIQARPDRDTCQEMFSKSRSEIEQEFFASLARQGFSRDQMHSAAITYGLSRYVESLGTSYGQESIDKALGYIEQHPWEGDPPSSGREKKDNVSSSYIYGNVNYRETGSAVALSTDATRRRWDALKLVKGQRLMVFYSEAAKELGVDKRTAMRYVGWLEEHGYVEKSPGRTKYLSRTEKGDRAAAARFCPLPLLLWLPQADHDLPDPPPAQRRGGKGRADAEGVRKLGPEDAARKFVRQLRRVSYDGRLRLTLEGSKRTFYLQILTHPDEIRVVRLHEQRRVGWQPFREGFEAPVLANFISRRDPELDGKNGYDPFIDRFGINPGDRGIAIAALLEKKDKRFEIAKVVDGNTELVPAIGFVVEWPSDFWHPLYKSLPNFHERVVRVSRYGRKPYRFSFADAGPAMPLDVEAQEHLELYLAEIADETRLRRLIDPLPDEWRFF